MPVSDDNTPKTETKRAATKAKANVKAGATKVKADVKAAGTKTRANVKATATKAKSAASNGTKRNGDTPDWRKQAGEYAGQAKAAAQSAAESAKSTTGDALHGLSKLMSDAAETIDNRISPQYGDYARKASKSMAGAAKSLDEADINKLTEDARDFVRKSPAVAIGAAAVVGFVLMRLMRGGSSDDDA